MSTFLRQVRSLSRLPASVGWPIWFATPMMGVAVRSIGVVSVVITGMGWGLQHWGMVEPLDLMVFDQLTQLQADAPPDPRLLLVTITEDDLRRYGWPLSDRYLAQALQQLQAHQPRVIGLDLYRDLIQPPGTESLEAALQAPNLIVIEDVGGGIPAPATVPADRVGFNDLTLDLDGVIRRNLLLVTTPEQDYYSFALRLCLAYLQPVQTTLQITPEALMLGPTQLAPLRPYSGGYQRVDAGGYQLLLQYYAPHNLAAEVTLHELLSQAVAPEQIRDRLVLIGTTAPSLKDFRPTPYSINRREHAIGMSGVLIHGQMVRQLLDLALGETKPWRFWPRWAEMGWLWLWALAGGSLVWRCHHPGAFGLVGGLGLGVMAGSMMLLFQIGIWVPLVEPLIGYLGAIGLGLIYRLFYTTTYDPLTGVLNRSAFLRYLDRSLQSPALTTTGLGVMFVELDRVRLIYRSLGPHVGDRFLFLLIHRLQQVLPTTARLARFDNDELAIAFPSLTQESWSTLADRLQAVSAQSILLNQHPLSTGLNIGIALTQPDHVHTPANLLRDANTAMYRAKALGQARYQVFAAGMLKDDLERFTLEHELRQGILAEEFVLYYQPITALRSGRILGFEALVRWQHPQRGFIAPYRFIPLAEETGLITSLGHWICRTACQQAMVWRQQFPDLPLVMSVNLSGRQFEQPDLVDQLVEILTETQLPGQALKLEVTESMVMGQVDAAIDRMLRLKALGCRLSLDDFGTGYSSLSYLRRFPIDTLKIDRSFVQKMDTSPEDYELVRMIVNLGHMLGMDIVAEGIETATEAEALRSLDCEAGQGYFWSKPLAVEDATTYLCQSPQAPPWA